MLAENRGYLWSRYKAAAVRRMVGILQRRLCDRLFAELYGGGQVCHCRNEPVRCGDGEADPDRDERDIDLRVGSEADECLCERDDGLSSKEQARSVRKDVSQYGAS
jgi:hypothetical protein